MSDDETKREKPEKPTKRRRTKAREHVPAEKPPAPPAEPASIVDPPEAYADTAKLDAAHWMPVFDREPVAFAAPAATLEDAAPVPDAPVAPVAVDPAPSASPVAETQPTMEKIEVELAHEAMDFAMTHSRVVLWTLLVFIVLALIASVVAAYALGKLAGQHAAPSSVRTSARSTAPVPRRDESLRVAPMTVMASKPDTVRIVDSVPKIVRVEVPVAAKPVDPADVPKLRHVAPVLSLSAPKLPSVDSDFGISREFAMPARPNVLHQKALPVVMPPPKPPLAFAELRP